MCHALLRDARFYSFLLEVDWDIAEKTRQEACPFCGGPLHCAPYERKPRGSLAEELGEEFRHRLSFCCGRDGCRRRQTPPSVRFLGRKLYLGVVVVLVGALRQGPTPRGLRKLQELFGADRRTIARWQEFWQEIFPATKFWASSKARFVPPVSNRQIPRALLRRFEGPGLELKLRGVLRFLAPITTRGGLALTGT